MPESRNRQGHTYQKQSAIPAKQRVKGRIIWAILFAVFGAIIAYFAIGENYAVLSLAAILAAVVGFVIGKSMEQDAKREK